MNEFEEMVSNMLNWSDDNLRREELDCLNTINHPSATDADIAEARQVLRAIAEARKQRKQIAAARAKWEEMQEGERLARIERYKDEAEMLQAESDTQPQQVAHPMNDTARVILKRYCYDSYTKEPANDISPFDRDEMRIYEHICKPRGMKAAASLILDIYGQQVRYDDMRKGLTFADWLKMWGDAYGVTLPNYKPAHLK